MSEIDQLLKKLCPTGVEFIPLWKLTAWDKRFNAVTNDKQTKVIKYHYYLANDLKKLVVPEGNVYLLSTGGYYGYTTEELVNSKMSEGEIVAIPWGGVATVQYYKGKFVTSDNRIATSLDVEILSNKFLYYYLKSKNDILQSFYRGSGIQHPSMAKVLDMPIPVPPLEVQNEIVRILDNFTGLEAELEAELEARKKQYEYYRNKLLTFDKNECGVQYKMLSEFAKCFAGATPKTGVEDYWKNGIIPWMSSGEVNKGIIYSTEKKITQLGYNNSSTKLVPPNTIVVALAGQGKTRGLVAITRIELCTNQSLCSIITDDTVFSDYLYYYLQTQYMTLRNISSGDGTRGGLNLQMINSFVVPIPPLKIQHEIVSKLEKFEAITKSLTKGIPAEIELRKQQYEYYRNKLLNFKEVTN